MSDSEIKSRCSNVPNVTISSEMFRTNVTAGLMITHLPRARLRVSSSVLGIRDRDYYESDEDGNVYYVGRMRRRKEHPAHTRRAKSVAGGEVISDKDAKRGPKVGKEGSASTTKPKKPKLEGWYGETKRRERPPRVKVNKPAKKNQMFKRFVDFWINYPLKILRIVATVLVFVYWVWLLLTFANSQSQGVQNKVKKHGCISKYTRLPKYSYDVFSDDKVDQEKELTVKMIIWGPFISEKSQNTNFTTAEAYGVQHVMNVILERWTYSGPKPTHDKMIQVPADAVKEGASGDALKQLAMVKGARKHERSALDYNNYPRKITLSIAISEQSVSGGQKQFYALGFGVNSAQSDTVPFSYEIGVDPLPMRKKVMYGLLPLLAYITFLLFGVNRAISAMFAVATSVACFTRVGLDEADTDGFFDSSVRYYDYDYLFFIFAVLVLGKLFAETNVQSYAAYYLLKVFRMKLIPVLIFINVVPALLSFAMNNVLVTELMIPLVMRLFELMGHDATPGLINTVVICNMMGRAFIGTYASSMMLRHKKADIAKVTLHKLLTVMAPLVCSVTFVIFVIYLLIFIYGKPHHYARMRQIEENEQLMRLCDITYASIPDFSKGWHRVRLKIQAMKAFFAFEIKEMRARVKKYGPEPVKDVDTKLYERRAQCRVHNWFLLTKCCVALGFYVLLTAIYIYKIKIPAFHQVEEMRLGYIGLFAAMCSILMVHSRDLELILKRIDWETIIVIACLTFIAQVFSYLCRGMPSYVWSLYGVNMKGSSKQKIHITVINVLALAALAGVANEYTIFKMFLDMACEYTVPSGLNSIDVLAAFFIGTGFWGIATAVGTTPNLVLVGQCYSQGYYHKITFFKFMLWALPTAVLTIILLYCALAVKIAVL